MREGFDVELVMPRTERQFEVTIIGNEVLLNNPPDADVVVIQRPLHWTRPSLIRQLRRRKIRVVVDLDDHFAAVAPSHMSYRHFDPRTSVRHNWDICREACARADRVTVTTPLLAKSYGDGDALVVPNRLPSDFVLDEPRVHERKDPRQVVVGWPGKITTHPGDLEATRQGVGRAQRKLHFTFKVAGDLLGVRRALALPHLPVHAHPVPYDEYPQLLSGFDVGIAPLAASDFNEAKSWLKPLELAARGVPFVASPSGPYSDLLRTANGFGQKAGTLVSTRQEWIEAVCWYVENADARSEAAAHGWWLAQANTIENNLEQWVEAWWLT